MYSARRLDTYRHSFDSINRLHGYGIHRKRAPVARHFPNSDTIAIFGAFVDLCKNTSRK